MSLFKMEMKMNRKSFLIWTICVAGICFACILMYSSMETSVAQIADMFSNMGYLSEMFGMDRISIGTLQGYFAIEVALMHGLGGAMFAAILGSSLLSKEESGHTAEFLNTLPMKRRTIAGVKYAVLTVNVLLFNLLSGALYLIGFVMLGERFDAGMLLLFLFAAAVMQLEIGSVCFMISAFQRRTQVGIGLGVTLILFCLDMVCRILPAMKPVKYFTPFYYANATDIFTNGKLPMKIFLIGVLVLVVSPVIGMVKYMRKDLAS